MKDKITSALSQLIGLDLSRVTRAANMQCFHFGTLTIINEKKAECEFTIDIQCHWRITNDSQIIVGYSDLYEPIEEDAEYDENFDYDIIGGNLRDIKLDNLLKEKKLTVENVLADNFGGFEIKFSNSFILTIFPTLTRKYEYGEFWRLLDNKNKNIHHFVVGTFGIE
jgi:hypothetical protein